MSSTLVRLAIEDETLIWAGLAAWLAGAGPGVEDREDKLLVKQLSNIHRHLWYTPTSIMEHNTKAGEKTKAWNMMDKKQKQWVNNNNNKETEFVFKDFY